MSADHAILESKCPYKPSGWYVSDWQNDVAHLFDTKAEAMSKARELLSYYYNSSRHSHSIINVDWLTAKRVGQSNTYRKPTRFEVAVEMGKVIEDHRRED